MTDAEGEHRAGGFPQPGDEDENRQLDGGREAEIRRREENNLARQREDDRDEERVDGHGEQREEATRRLDELHERREVEAEKQWDQ